MDPSTPENKGSRHTTNNNNNQTSPKASSSSSTTTSITRELGQYKRSYTCTFCEKGFSNAQALGGHMNIHRRDRARLRNLDDSDLGTKHSTLTMISWNPDHSNQSIPNHHDPDLRVLRLSALHPPQEDRSNGQEEVDLELRLGMTPRSEP